LLNSTWRIKVLVLIAFIYKKYWDFNGDAIAACQRLREKWEYYGAFKKLGTIGGDEHNPPSPS
jgi:hypothetical protein